MQEKVKILNLDHFGNGITRLNNKVIFVKNALKDEIVDIKIIEEHKKYDLAVVTKYHEQNPKRIPSKCPYFGICGGCQLLFYAYLDTLNWKKTKVKELLTQAKINYPKEIEIIANKDNFNYRNKISLKIINGKLGFFEEKSHQLVEINNCLMARFPLNEVIKNFSLLNIFNGTLTIRTNTNNEILLIIETKEECKINISKLKETIKLVGIVFNNQTIYGNNFLYERIGGFLFKISYNAFFQINPYITEKLFSLISENILPNTQVLDLYSGVGTLSIVASLKAQNVTSIEIVKNAILDGIHNAKINNRHNINFLLGDVAKTVNKLTYDIDTLIIDPPRNGLDKNTLIFIKNHNFKKIIYISCDVSTLIRDLKALEDKYLIIDYKILDMFSYSYHLENIVILNLK